MYFEIVSASGGYRVHVKDQNHKIIFWSEVYVRKQGALHAAQLLQVHAGDAVVHDRA